MSVAASILRGLKIASITLLSANVLMNRNTAKFINIERKTKLTTIVLCGFRFRCD